MIVLPVGGGTIEKGTMPVPGGVGIGTVPGMIPVWVMGGVPILPLEKGSMPTAGPLGTGPMLLSGCAMTVANGLADDIGGGGIIVMGPLGPGKTPLTGGPIAVENAPLAGGSGTAVIGPVRKGSEGGIRTALEGWGGKTKLLCIGASPNGDWNPPLAQGVPTEDVEMFGPELARTGLSSGQTSSLSSSSSSF